MVAKSAVEWHTFDTRPDQNHNIAILYQSADGSVQTIEGNVRLMADDCYSFVRANGDVYFLYEHGEHPTHWAMPFDVPQPQPELEFF